ncbi:MAG: TonB-dependent receptor [Candidatus Neomarinimicrobiota bacterium]
MSKRLLYIIIMISAFAFGAKHSLRGVISDATTGEDLIGATISLSDGKGGTFSNSYGFYSLTLPDDEYILNISFIGYKDLNYKIDLKSNQVKNFELTPAVIALNEVEVSADRPDINISSTQMSVAKLNIKNIEMMPVLFGESDILKTLQLLPGISTASEGSTGFSVRGGAIDENLILLDEATVYSPSHLMGFVSVFNSDALKDVTVYKGGIPATYGGRASSVIDVQMNNGNNKEFSAKAGIGLISSRLTVEGPIVKDCCSFIVSARRSYADIILKALPLDLITNETQLYFYDLNAKANLKIKDNDRLFISGYFGKDVFGFDGIMGTDWGNATFTGRWNHIFGDKLFSNTSFIYSDYDYGFQVSDLISMSSGIDNITFKQDFSYFPNPDLTTKIGFNTSKYTFNPGKLNMGLDSADFKLVMDEQGSIESGIYFSNEHKITPLFSAEYGLRTSMYNQIGPGWIYSYDEDNYISDSTWYNKWEPAQTYWNLEPRVSFNYLLSEKNSFKVSYNRMAQYVHQLSNSTSGQATDVWISSSTLVKPLLVDQFALGYFHNFLDNGIETSIEVYYKDMQGVSDFEDGTDIMFNDKIEAQILNGKGRAYGLELYLKKNYGKFNGWLSYTLARTEQKIPGINNDNWYAAKHDRIHDLSFVLNYSFSKKINLSGTWVYYTGSAVTFPSGQYIIDGQVVPYYTERNGYRMPDYHRLDLNLHLKGKDRKNYSTSWDISIYNVYNRYNAYSISFRASETNPGDMEAVKLSLFGIVPSLTFNINL